VIIQTAENNKHKFTRSIFSVNFIQNSQPQYIDVV
ncbi:uncharacterized protein METZ01_LOCUS467691, partial [marine metagenome]